MPPRWFLTAIIFGLFCGCGEDSNSLAKEDVFQEPIYTDVGVPISSIVGEEFEIALELGGIAGITWDQPSISNAEIVRFVSERTGGFVCSKQRGKPCPDDAGTLYYRFESISVGNVIISLQQLSGTTNSRNFLVIVE